MKKFVLAALAAAAFPGSADAAVTYSFFTNEPFAGGPLEFTLTADNYITDGWIQRSALTSATASIQRVRFEASCPQRGSASLCDQISVFAETGFGTTVAYRYFNDGALSAAGSYTDKQSSTGANLTVSTSVSSAVPEPATWAMMIVGFSVIGFSIRRRTNLRFA